MGGIRRTRFASACGSPAALRGLPRVCRRGGRGDFSPRSEEKAHRAGQPADCVSRTRRDAAPGSGEAQLPVVRPHLPGGSEVSLSLRAATRRGDDARGRGRSGGDARKGARDSRRRGRLRFRRAAFGELGVPRPCRCAGGDSAHHPRASPG